MKPEEPTELKPSEKPLIVAGQVQVPSGEYDHPKLPDIIDIMKNSK